MSKKTKAKLQTFKMPCGEVLVIDRRGNLRREDYDDGKRTATGDIEVTAAELEKLAKLADWYHRQEKRPADVLELAGGQTVRLRRDGFGALSFNEGNDISYKQLMGVLAMSRKARGKK